VVGAVVQHQNQQAAQSQLQQNHQQAQQMLSGLDPTQATALRTDKAFKKRVLATLKVFPNQIQSHFFESKISKSQHFFFWFSRLCKICEILVNMRVFSN
jgi:hemerythrin-like domain-containing protein